MTPAVPRSIRAPLIWAKPSPPLFTKARGHNPYARAGLAFQRKVGRALTSLSRDVGASLETEPWFTFRDANGDGACSPDFILNLLPRALIVIEVKLKYVLGAEAKLKSLYLPIVAAARGERLVPRSVIYPLVITKILTQDCAGLAIETVSEALTPSSSFRSPVLQWLGTGRILWEPIDDANRRRSA